MSEATIYATAPTRNVKPTCPGLALMGPEAMWGSSIDSTKVIPQFTSKLSKNGFMKANDCVIDFV